MNSPNESLHMAAAADNYDIDLGDAPLGAVDLQRSITDHPMTSALVAAAAGAGLMALVVLSMRRGPSTAEQLFEQAAPSAATRDEMAGLRDQFVGWARDMLSAAPSRGEVKRAAGSAKSWLQDLLDATPSRGEVKKAADDAADTMSSTWGEVRDQATDLAQRVRSQVEGTADKLRPKVSAAVDLAKENPMWLGVALAALAAVVGASAIAGSRK